MTLATDIAVGDPGHAGLHNDERTAINAKPDTFIELSDAPSSMAAAAGQVPVVNAGETALEFAEAAAVALRPANTQTASYTLVLADAAKAVHMDVATANNLTVPPNSSVAFPVGTMVPVLQVGAGATTVVAGVGVTVNTPDDLTVGGQWSTVWLRKSATDVWVLSRAGAGGGGGLVAADIDTLAELNAIITDATLDDSSDARTPTAHASTHATGDSDALAPADIGAATSAQGALADTAVQPGDDADTLGSGAATDGHVLTADGAGGAAWEAAPAGGSSTVTANVQTASYTLVLADAGKAVEMNVASANNLTVPPNSSVAFPNGTLVEVCQVGAGQTTVVAGSGVTIRTPETLVLSGQWSTVNLRKRATDEWVLAGDVEAAV